MFARACQDARHIVIYLDTLIFGNCRQKQTDVRGENHLQGSENYQHFGLRKGACDTSISFWFAINVSTLLANCNACTLGGQQS